MGALTGSHRIDGPRWGPSGSLIKTLAARSSFHEIQPLRNRDDQEANRSELDLLDRHRELWSGVAVDPIPEDRRVGLYADEGTLAGRSVVDSENDSSATRVCEAHDGVDHVGVHQRR